MEKIENTGDFTVETVGQLDEIYGRSEFLGKETDYVTPPGRAFIAASPFLILATASENGIDC